MPSYIALLRGINVGGKRKILMQDLKPMFNDLGYTNVNTYIQSGNVLFDSEHSDNLIDTANQIEVGIRKTFGFDVPVIVLSSHEMKAALEAIPFNDDTICIDKLYFTFLKQKPNEDNLGAIDPQAFIPDEFKIDNQVIYIRYDQKYSKSKLTNDLFEKRLKVQASTRNWKTVNKLIEMSKEGE